MAKKFIKQDYRYLEEMYKNGEPINGNFKSNRRSFWKRFTMAMFVIFLIGSMVAWAGFYFLNNYSDTSSGQVSLQLSAPERSAIGGSVEFKINIVNNSKDDVKNLSLRVNYPDGFVWRTSSENAETSSNNTWSFDKMGPNEKKEIIIQGILLGEVGSLKTIFGVLNYHLTNFSSELEVSDSKSVVLEQGPFTFDLSGSNQATPGEEASYEVTYKNTGDTSLPELSVVLLLPNDFTISTTEPEPSIAGEWRWPLPPIAPGEEGKITFKGSWGATVSGDQMLTASLEGKSDTGRNIVVTTSEFSVKISDGEVILKMTIDGKDSPSSADLGSVLKYSLSYENSSTESIGDVEISVSYQSSLIDWSKVELDDGGEVSGSTMKWSYKNTPSLVRILSNTKGQLNWEVPLVKVLPPRAKLTISSLPTFTYHKRGENLFDRTIDGAVLIVPVTSGASVSVSARYFDDDHNAVGSGPLPPKVGATTSYQIVWKISSNVHTLKNIIVASALPDNVIAKQGTATIGTMRLRSDGSPEWVISSLSPGVEPEAVFNIELKPTQADEGKIVVLSGQIILNATDQETGGTVKTVGNVATSNLENDGVARGQGVVSK